MVRTIDRRDERQKGTSRKCSGIDSVTSTQCLVGQNWVSMCYDFSLVLLITVCCIGIPVKVCSYGTVGGMTIRFVKCKHPLTVYAARC